MEHRIVIGNMISFVAAVFMMVSCCVNDQKRAYFCQMMNCAILCVASVFFGSWAGLTTLVISATRNCLVMLGRYTKKMMYIFTPLVFVVGLLVNNRGLIGMLPPVATVQLSLCNYYAKSLLATKLSFFVNNLLWVVYAFAILDLSSGLMDGSTCIIGLISIVRLIREEKREKKTVPAGDRSLTDAERSEEWNN